MAALLFAERAPESANVLVIGAGGGMELTALARVHPQWQLVGVDPSQPMLDLAAAALGPLAARAQLHLGYTDTAPVGPFDAATCLLTRHFVPIEERRSTLKEIRRRLKPGAPFVMASSRGTPARQDPPSGRPCRCSALSKRRSCFERPTSRTFGCSMPAWLSGAGWRKPE
ncbi:SAM-dependent methyltransferase [Variovorax boronicumulans]|uniref:class I SAM-dependent methyltransferase n=1 Tax=Variovorax boronicumulans TaxID=436515 RepID=UPI00278131BE|nr:class I SAM-dependent methyltransferase [Variovorax boronicumulans]MDQ0068695.1 SAM-dependent methyltransferase [Variovorax boronicumulans]